MKIAGTIRWKGVVRADRAWALVFAATALALAVLAPLGMVEADPVSLAALVVVLAGCVLGALRREEVACRMGRPHRPVARLVTASLAVAACAALALELPSNHELWNMDLASLGLEVSILFALSLFLSGIFRAHGAPAAVLTLLCTGIGIGEHFVSTFKAMPIQPGDLFAVGTAATVAGGYQYLLTPYCLYAICFMALGLLAAFLMRPWVAQTAREPVPAGSRKTGAARGSADAPAVSAVEPDEAPAATAPAFSAAPRDTGLGKPVTRRAAVAAGLGLAFLAAQPFVDYYDTLGIRVGSWYPLRSYYKYGFIPSFISGTQKMIPSKPKGYKRADADGLIERYARVYARDAKLGASPDRTAAEAQFAQLKPSVVCIMNESFSNLAVFDGLRCGYAGPQRFLGIDDALLAGVSYMSAYGAGTCNSEFEFLTGHSMAFLGGGVYPYMVYNLAPSENLARQFKKQGYRAVAMHPNHATNWNRQNVFQDMGFDNFYTIEDAFKGAPTLCNKVTDAATYDECLKVLRQSDEPVFIHDVTMQNHSGYDTGLIPAGQRVMLAPPGADADHVAWTDEYLALMEESDRAFKAFLDELRQMDRSVVVVMYGDHQPFFSNVYNDAYFTGEGEAEHAARIWQTRYVVWANYDVAGSAQRSEGLDTSINNVGALALQAIGAPLSCYQRAHLALMKEMPAISVAVRRDGDGSWHLPDERSASSDARDDYAKMQYRKLFDHGGSVFATKKQAAANETDPNAAPGKDA